MKTVLATLSILLLFTSAFSRLILPSQIPGIIEKTQKYLQPELRDLDYPLDASSTANPVQGILNATSGYLSVNDPNTASKLFYVFYSCRGLQNGQVPKDVPIIIWLQGGPGGSSQLGSFYEFGPYELKNDPKTGKPEESPRDLSWNDYYNLLIVDNPRGVGYSVADQNSYVTTEDEVGDDFVQALLSFYGLDAFSNFAETPLFIFGESYAGHYIPAISKKVLEYNLGPATLKIPLAGVGIGDGWTDPIHQLANYGLFAFSLGFVDYNERETVERNQLLGISNILNGDYVNALNNFDTLTDVITTSGGNLNVYNFREFGDYDTSALDLFFNDAETAQRYNVDPSRVGTYTDENDDVYNALSNDFMQSVADRVAYVADSGLPVLLYNGQYDIIVNTPTALNWIGELEWSGQAAFYDAPLQNWIYNNGTPVGIAKNRGNFTFVVVNKAGHLSPMDQIEVTTEMVRRFTSGNNQWNQIFNEEL